MLKEEQQNPNPLPPGIDSPTNQHAGGTMSETTSTVMHSASNSDVVASHVVNDDIATTTTTQPKNIPVLQCEIYNVTCNTQDVLEIHKLGEKHLKTLQKLAESSANAPNTPVPPTEALTMSPVDAVPSAITEPKMSPTKPVVAVASETLRELDDKNQELLQSGDICNMRCSNQDEFMEHVASKKRSEKACRFKWAQKRHIRVRFQKQFSNETATFQCEVCKISCNSNEHLNRHFSGKKHLKKLKQSEEIPDPSVVSLDQPESSEGKTVELHQGKPLSCDVCGIACNSNDMLKKHISGKKHQKNREKSLKPIGPSPAPAMEPVATAPTMIGPLQDEGKMVEGDGSNNKAKRARCHEDVGKKKQKLLQGGASNALSRCTLCNVVCTSSDGLISHFAGKKHLKLALKQAEAQST